MQQIEEETVPPVKTAEVEFGEAVRYYRGEAGLSQRRLAELLTEKGFSIDPSAITRIEKGARAVRIGEAVAIAGVLGLSISDLIDAAEDEVEALSRLRIEANREMHRARGAVATMVEMFQEVDVFLHQHPELMKELSDEKDSAPETPDEYLAWVDRRIVGLGTDEEAGGWHLVVEPDRRRRQALVRLTRSLLHRMVVPKQLPTLDPSVPDSKEADES